MTRTLFIQLVMAVVAMVPHRSAAAAEKPAGDHNQLAGSSRSEKNGWVFVHLEGRPEQIGYQHGYLLAEEIADLLQVCKPYLEKTTKRDWNFYRQAGERMLWPKIEPEYQQEIDGIVSGLKALRLCGRFIVIRAIPSALWKRMSE